MLTKNRIIFLVYFAQLGFLLGTEPLTYLMVAYLTAEFAAIILVFTFYKMRHDGNYITHMLNIPGGALFVFLFCIIAYYLGVAVEEIPEPIRGQEANVNPLEPFIDNFIPISFTFIGVLAALLAEVLQMEKIKQMEFLDREFRLQTLTVLGVIAVGLFSSALYQLDYRIPIIAMGLARLGMETYSTKKHLKLKKVISEKMNQAKSQLNVR
ncbi:hypothetical protein O3Q51_06495 [Cryomorphaceae bacterium 1068]|nr:hypothetical protein [Cryomorphaceae bacterium 1068]